MSGDRTLRWCAEHDEPAWVYDDGSSWCWYDSIVEASNPHQIVNLPQDDEIERLRAEVERLMDGMEWAWSIIANGQYWDATDAVRHPEWEQAKFKWRDEHWHPALDRNKEPRRG